VRDPVNPRRREQPYVRGKFGDVRFGSLADIALSVPIKVERDMARLLSVNVGLPRDIEWKNRTVHTAIWKDPVGGRCRVGRLNLEGDGQGDLVGHGGEQQAVFVYQIESYRYWQQQLKRTDFVHGRGLVSGEVAYEPQPLEQPADGNLVVCCSQPIRDAVIDL
jgi:hypothetical protein